MSRNGPAADFEERTHFDAEAAATLYHPNSVKIFQVGQMADQPQPSRGIWTESAARLAKWILTGDRTGMALVERGRRKSCRFFYVGCSTGLSSTSSGPHLGAKILKQSVELP